MDVSGSLNFGRLIRTFLPGFIGFVVLMLLVDSILHLIAGLQYPILSWVQANPLIFTLLAIPFSLIIGVLLNTIFILFLFPFIIKMPYQKKNSDFIKVENETMSYLINQRLLKSVPNEKIKSINRYLEKDFLRESFSLGFIPVEKIVFQEEGFWDYLEFQLTLAFITIFLGASTILTLSAYGVFTFLGLMESIKIIILCVVCTGVLSVMLLRAARINYDYHKKSKFSLMLGQYTSVRDFESVQNQKNKKVQL